MLDQKKTIETKMVGAIGHLFRHCPPNLDSEGTANLTKIQLNSIDLLALIANNTTNLSTFGNTLKILYSATQTKNLWQHPDTFN